MTTKTAAQRLEDWLPERTRNDPEAMANFRWRVKQAVEEGCADRWSRPSRGFQPMRDGIDYDSSEQ